VSSQIRDFSVFTDSRPLTMSPVEVKRPSVATIWRSALHLRPGSKHMTARTIGAGELPMHSLTGVSER
jgi:hypothetical protein